MKQQRIEFVDLAKGLCISLVVMYHVFGLSSGKYLDIINLFRMPLYFVLSGIFFKPSYGFKVFLKKKINKLLIPFLITLAAISVPGAFLLDYIQHKPTDIWDFLPDNHLHIPIYISIASWFLLCLFNLNMLFFALFKICKGKMMAMAVCACCMGAAGYVFGKEGIILPLWLDSTMTAAPFFMAGIFIKNSTSILEENYNSRLTRIATVALLLLLAVHAIDVSPEKATLSYKDNVFSINMASLYLGGMCGFLLIFIISKYLERLPIFSYIGRYSIVVLITHQIYLFILRNVLYQLGMPQDNIYLNIAVFILIILLELPTIKYGIKYCPYWFAQKDLLVGK